MLRLAVVSLIAVLFSASAEARVFNLKDRSFATYFGGTIGSSQMSKQPWGDSSGPNTITDQPIRLNYSGEFGVLFATQKVNFRAGVEFLQPQNNSDIKGRNASDVLFTLDSNVRAIVPKGTIEFAVYKTPSSALIFGGSVGYATVTMENRYEMTAAGSTEFSGLGNFTEKASGTGLQGEGFLGYELSFSDNVTLFTNLGYRYMLVDDLKHETAGPTILGTVAKGDAVRKQNGDKRQLDFSSAQAAIQFRFYF